MSLESLRDVLASGLRDLYNAENQLIRALPKMAKAASNPDLREAIEGHLEETRTHAKRLEECCERLDINPKGKTCQAMKGLVKEGSEVLEEKGNEAAKDAAMIAAAQRVEHYEISAYGSLRSFAEEIGESDIVTLLNETLEEESAANETLSRIASGVNETAANAMEVDSEDAELLTTNDHRSRRR